MVTDTREIRVSALALVVSAAFMLAVLASGRVPPGDFAALLGVYVQSFTNLWLVVGAIGLFIHCGRRTHTDGRLVSPFAVIRDWLAMRWQRDRLLGVVTPPLVCMIALASFNGFKQMLLPDAGFGMDALFADLDRALFLGNEPWVVTHDLLGSVAATNAIDAFYHGWFVPMALGIIVVAFISDATLRLQYALSYLLMWIIIGCGLAWLLPSAGPCYYEAFHADPRFAELMARLTSADAALKAGGGDGIAALLNQEALLANFGRPVLALGGGISAMPSMHNAMSVLFALGAMRMNRWLGAAMWVYAFVIWIGSIHLGWHYALDGVVAAVATLAIWQGCGLWLRRMAAAETRIANIAVPAE